MDSNHRPSGYEPNALPLRHRAVNIKAHMDNDNQALLEQN